jgi:hypothetical protein
MPDWYANTPKPAAGKERLNAYYLALGCFTHRFAWVEEAVHTVLSHYAKLPPAAARALLSGVRVDETKNRLSRLHEVGLISDADWMDVEPMFQQLGIINNRRNEIFHHGASFIAEGAGVVTNATMALTEERITKFDISADIIDDMTADLKKIFFHLYVRHMGQPQKHPKLEEILREPWRYKPQSVPPTKSHKSSRREGTKPPARTSSPKSSPKRR